MAHYLALYSLFFSTDAEWDIHSTVCSNEPANLPFLLFSKVFDRKMEIKRKCIVEKNR